MKISVHWLCLFMVATAATADDNKKYPTEPLPAIEFRFEGALPAVVKLDGTLRAHLKIFPGKNIKDVKIEEAECVDLGREQDYPNLIKLLCDPSESVLKRVATAYWQAIAPPKDSDALAELRMTTFVAVRAPCDGKKCTVTINQTTHPTQVPCSPADVRGYGRVCTHNGVPDAAHICKQPQ